MNWTEEDVTTLRGLWMTNTPIAAIGVALGRTENSVIGKASREKLPHKRQLAAPKKNEPPPFPATAIPFDEIADIRLPKRLRDVVAVLIDIYPAGMSCARIGELVYADEEDGGPSNAKNAVAYTIKQLRQVLRPLGWDADNCNDRKGVRLCAGAPVTARRMVA